LKTKIITEDTFSRYHKQTIKLEEKKVMNKKYWIFAVLLVSVLVLGACGSSEPAADEAAELTYDEKGIPVYGCLGSADTALVDLECREVTVAVENAYLPYNYIDVATGQAGGWDYEVVPALCELLHCTPVFQECSWDIMIQSVADGLYDMAGDGITINDEREEIVDFSDGYVQTEQRLLVLKGEDRFASMEDFVAMEELIMGTQVATTNYETAIEYLPEDRVSAFEQYPFAVAALISGDVDAVIIDAVVGLGYVGENADDLELIGPSLSSDQLGFAFPNDSELVEPFNQAIAELKDSGVMNEINLKYYGPDFTITYDDIQ
jgi:polar amino acid transport system substrate-binding protein